MEGWEESVGETEEEEVGVSTEDTVQEALRVAEAEGLGVPAAVAEALLLCEGVAVGEPLPEPLAEGVSVLVTDCVCTQQSSRAAQSSRRCIVRSA